MSSNHFPLVSVMIPYYNCKAYIAETIASVEQQSYPNIEIIVVDDGSNTEDTDYLLGLLQGKPDIRHARQSNKGLSATRNHAASMASGTYFLFLDADDLILPDYIEKSIAVLESNPNCKLVYPHAEFFDACSGKWELPAYESLKKLLEGNHIPAIAIHRANDFINAGGFDEQLKTHEDWDLWIRILAGGGTAFHIPHILFRYRKRRDRSSLTDGLVNDTSVMQHSWQQVYIKNSRIFMQHGLGYYNLIHSWKKQQKYEKSCLRRLTKILKNKK